MQEYDCKSNEASQVRLFILSVAMLHAIFMVCELYPWENPILLKIVSKKLPESEKFTSSQRNLIATIVHNAGIYNFIIAGGLAWAAFSSNVSIAVGVSQVLLIGAGVAGIFGTLTLKSPLTVIQALAGIAGFLLVSSRGLT
jgi:uncharacterized membrane protein